MVQAQNQSKNPRQNASIISIVTFAWLYKIIRQGFTRKLETSDIYPVLPELSSEVIGHRVFQLWEEENVNIQRKDQRSHPSLIKVLAQSFRKDFLINGSVLIFSRLTLRISECLLLMKVLGFFNYTQEKRTSEVYYWVLGLIFVKYTHSLTAHLLYRRFADSSLKVKSACCLLIYKKILRLSLVNKNETSVGKVVNILSQDVRVMEQLSYYCYYLIYAPIEIVVIAILIYCLMGFVPFFGLFIILLTIPMQGYAGKWLSRQIEKRASLTDKRLSFMSEFINGIQVIKMYTWEKSFSYLFEKTRTKEMKVIKKMSIIHSIIKSFKVYVPQICLFITVVSCTAFGTTITAENFYTLALIYAELRISFYSMFIRGMEFLAKGVISARRIETFMNCQEKEPLPKIIQSNENSIPIRLSEVSAKWSSASKEDTVNNMTLGLNSGTLRAIIGQVGSGKSSLLQIILGELPILKGDIKVVGKMSYASQEPWIFASTIRQNIVLGQAMDKERYAKVIKVCQLDQDIATFPSEDQTLIGEKGRKLSGGQRARINLARAVYSEADIYMFDDPLSAVDAEVGKRIFEDCICGFLKDKTRILVTHQLQFLKSVDGIILLKNGFLQAEGTLEQVLKSDIDFLKVLNMEKQENTEDVCDNVNQKSFLMKTEAQEQKESSELRMVGKFSKGVFWIYFKEVGNPWLVILTLLLGLVYQIFLTSGDLLLSRWLNLEKRISTITSVNRTITIFEEFELPRKWYIQTCSLLYISVIVLLFLYTFAFYEMVMRSSQKLHQSMFYSVIRTTMLFFHENSSGRILNRFSKDIGTVDVELPNCLADTIRIGLVLSAVTSITLAFKPSSLIFALILGTFLYFLCIIYMKTIHSLKHLESTTNSPVFGHVNATLDGLITIRALKAEDIMEKEFSIHQDLSISAQFLFLASAEAFGYYLELLSLLFVTSVIYLLIFSRDKIHIGDAGLIISQLLSICNTIHHGIKMATEVDNHLTSVERILEYRDLDQEPPFESRFENKAYRNWPSKGRLEFKNVSLSYHPGGSRVLTNLNFEILPKEKIGIVGRTGAGKSSLIVALFRLAYVEGEIFIDDVETSDLSLKDLRSNISIIPQQPLLFAASLRKNLDPFDEYSDDELWQALEDVELKHVLKDMETGLDIKISDGGSNFSVGQRQLLSLARAILKNNKILVLDEATANVDLQTDALIQKTIRRRFKGRTVLIIAHRLNTVMDCDKFIVLNEGSLVEFDCPHLLLQNNEGYLYKMVQKTGSSMSKALTSAAEKNYQHRRTGDSDAE